MKIMISVLMICLILAIVIFLIKKYQLSKDQQIIFWILVLFWSSISIIRSYRKLYVVTAVDSGGLGLSAEVAAQVAAAYGLMSLIVRLPIFLISDIFRKRKIFIQIALFALVLSSFLVVFNANYHTMYFSSLAMGLGATMIAMFNVIFSETFEKDKATVSVSILSAAPLLAEFVAAPIQYIYTHNAIKDYHMMWLVAGILALVTFLLSFKMKDYVSYDTSFSFSKFRQVVSHKEFIYMCILALLVSFIKFATSGANMLTFAKMEFNMSPLMLAYMDTVFVVPQLIAGILVGTYLKNKLGVRNSLMLSFSAALLFYLVVLFVNNQYVVYASYLFNGLFYGGVYNLMIGMAMQYFDRDYRNVSMGVYQAFFALGIYYGDYIYVYIARHLENGMLGFNQNKSIFLLTLILTILSMLMVRLRIKN